MIFPSLTIITLVTVDILFGYLKKYINNAEDMIDGAPVILVEHGQMLRGKMKEADITYDDIMVSARNNQGIDKLDDIKYAILERNGHISIIAKSP